MLQQSNDINILICLEVKIVSYNLLYLYRLIAFLIIDYIYIILSIWNKNIEFGSKRFF